MDVLFVCTGNICRSPMAEAFLRHRLASRGIPANVHSAGLLQAGIPASSHGVDVLRSRQVDIATHRSTTLSTELIDGADLLIGMARLHLREAVVLRPAAWPKSFTLKEIVRRGEERGGRARGQSLEDWLAKIHAGRSHSGLLGEADGDDIFDPIGSNRSSYERTAIEIDNLVERLVALLFGQDAGL